MFCYKCGKQLPDNSKFCGYCGASVPVLKNKPVSSNVNASEEKKKHMFAAGALPVKTVEKPSAVGISSAGVALSGGGLAPVVHDNPGQIEEIDLKRVKGNEKNSVGTVASGSSGLYIVDFFQRLFRKSNVWTIVYMIINILIIALVLFGNANPVVGILLAVFIYGVSLTIALSPLGEFILRFQTGCQKFKRIDQLNYIEPIFDEVYAKAKLADPTIPEDVQLYYSKEDYANAFALGRKTIVVTKGMLKNATPDELKGVLAHEFGHLAHKDTDVVLAITVGNMIVNVIIVMIRIAIAIFDLINGLLAITMGEEGFLYLIFMTLYKFIITVTISLALRIWTNLGSLMVLKSSRDNEYLADEFSFNLGYGKGLVSFLDHDESEQPSGLFATLSKSHPATDDRIARLQRLGVDYKSEFAFND